MTKPYRPQPGTVAALALEHLQTLPVGQEIANAVLAEQIGHLGSAVVASLKPALGHGLIQQRRAPESGVVFWSRIGDLSVPAPPAAVPGSADDFEREPVQVVLQQGQWPPVKAPAAVKDGLTAEPVLEGQREQHLVTRAWFCSDGQMVIETPEHEFVFPRLEARQFLRAIRELGEAVAA